MNYFGEDDFKRDSYSSTLSEDSNDSQLSITLHRSKFHSNSFGYKMDENPREISLNEQSKEKISFSGEFLFFGPLILCLILLISGIVVFIIVEQRNNKHKNKEIYFNYPLNLTPNDNFLPISCPFVKPDRFVEETFVLNQLKCGLHRSSVINIYYLNNPRPIYPSENLTMENVINPPIIQLNNEFLSKINTKSFILILIASETAPGLLSIIVLHWIRYFSSSLEDEEDICYYELRRILTVTSQKMFLLYATNSTKMMIRAKTFCNQMTGQFQLTEYVTFIKLKLIGSTNFFIPYVHDDTPDDDE